MHAAGGDGVEVGREGRHEGLALTGLHLGDVAEMQGGATHELHVEVAHAERAHRGLAHRGEGLGQQVVERLAVRVAHAELDGLVLELLVAQRREVVFEVVHRFRVVREAAQEPALSDAKRALEYVGHGTTPLAGVCYRPVMVPTGAWEASPASLTSRRSGANRAAPGGFRLPAR